MLTEQAYQATGPQATGKPRCCFRLGPLARTKAPLQCNLSSGISLYKIPGCNHPPRRRGYKRSPTK